MFSTLWGAEHAGHIKCTSAASSFSYHTFLFATCCLYTWLWPFINSLMHWYIQLFSLKLLYQQCCCLLLWKWVSILYIFQNDFLFFSWEVNCSRCLHVRTFAGTKADWICLVGLSTQNFVSLTLLNPPQPNTGHKRCLRTIKILQYLIVSELWKNHSLQCRAGTVLSSATQRFGVQRVWNHLTIEILIRQLLHIYVLSSCFSLLNKWFIRKKCVIHIHRFKGIAFKCYESFLEQPPTVLTITCPDNVTGL